MCFTGTVQVLLQDAVGLHEHQNARGQELIGQWLESLVSFTLKDTGQDNVGQWLSVAPVNRDSRALEAQRLELTMFHSRT